MTIPTPIYNNHNPDLRILNKCLNEISSLIKKGDTIILESTVYPSYSTEFAIPLLEKKSKLKCNSDFYFGYSPERVNPGDKINNINNIVKIVSGSNKIALNKISNLYSRALGTKIHKVKSLSVAESAKIIENTQRDLNIALINEFSIFLDKMNIDYNEVLSAAKTKWNFLNFNRGLVGGHCIGVDPYYLIYKANDLGLKIPLIEEGRKVNDNMPKYLAHKIKSQVKKKKAKILILGLSFKEDCSDVRNSKVIDLYKILLSFNFKPEIHDPLVSVNEVKTYYKIDLLINIHKNFDLIVIAKKHKIFNKGKYLNFINFYKKNNLVLEL